MMRYFQFFLALFMCSASSVWAGTALIDGRSFADLTSAWNARDNSETNYPALVQRFGAGAPIVVTDGTSYRLQWAYYANGAAQETINGGLAALQAVFPAATTVPRMLSTSGCADPRTEEQKQQNTQQNQQEQQQHEDPQDPPGIHTVIETGDGKTTININIDNSLDVGSPPSGDVEGPSGSVGQEFYLHGLDPPIYEGAFIKMRNGGQHNEVIKGSSFYFDSEHFWGAISATFNEHFPLNDFTGVWTFSDSGAVLTPYTFRWQMPALMGISFPEWSFQIDPAAWLSHAMFRVFRAILAAFVYIQTTMFCINLFR